MDDRKSERRRSREQPRHLRSLRPVAAVFSERSIVGEWKDGTQQYFDDGFAREWGRRMETVMAKEFGKYTDEEIVGLAHQFGASYIVGQGRRRALPVVFDGGSTVVYSVP